MKLECGHDEEAGLVCAACAVETIRDLAEAKERLGLIRRYTGLWVANGGPLMAYLGRRLLKVLDADEQQLRALTATKLLAAQEEELEAREETSCDEDQLDRLGRRRLTLGEHP